MELSAYLTFDGGFREALPMFRDPRDDHAGDAPTGSA
jgi:hypothetical protein